MTEDLSRRQAIVDELIAKTRGKLNVNDFGKKIRLLEKFALRQMPVIFQYNVRWKPSPPAIANGQAPIEISVLAHSPSAARSRAMPDLKLCSANWAEYLETRAKKVGPPKTTARFRKVAEQRGCPWAEVGMMVTVKERVGWIVGYNDSCNFDVWFLEDGRIFNCHPQWEMVFFGDDMRRIGHDEDNNWYTLLALAAETLAKVKPSEVVVGMEWTGFDRAIATCAASQNIPIVAAIPFESHKQPYKTFLDDYAHLITEVVVSPGNFAKWKYQKRNEYIVDHCDQMVALWDGSAGGTRNCVDYAKRVKRPIGNAWSRWEALRDDLPTIQREAHNQAIA